VGKRVAFRTDASLEIGTGHVMRCLTLAETLATHGAVCHFVCREHPGHLLDYIRKSGFVVYPLTLHDPRQLPQRKPTDTEPAHLHWLGCDWLTDAWETGECLKALNPEWLVVDHYALDSRWEQALKERYRHLLAIDDLADRPHACDVLLDQNLGRGAVDYAKYIPVTSIVLAGPRYALLRPEFSIVRQYSLERRRSGQLKHLLISMGGVDRSNATVQMLKALKTCPLPTDCKITVVMGAKAPWIEEVRAIAATMPWSIEVRVDITDMAQVMASSDLAIGAAGGTSWERCCVGLPTLLVVLAGNQEPAACHMGRAGVSQTLLIDQTLESRLREFITLAVDQPEWLIDMSKKAAAVTDGNGAERVVSVMMRTEAL
jgi:UDP-2,4-diacetamido-2,4,6-trideoxy-beta-L-altropyranose hydrolase